MANSAKASMGGCQFKQPLVSQTPVFDRRRKHLRAGKKHSGNLARKPNYLK